MTRYIACGFNAETGETYRQEESDRAGAEHAASSWLELKPLYSIADVIQDVDGKMQVVTSWRRVCPGIELVTP